MMVDKAMSGMPTDSSIAGTERLLTEATDGAVILVSAIAAYSIDQLHGATVITDIVNTDQMVIFNTGDDEKIITAANFSGWIKNEIEEATVGTTIVGGDGVVYVDGGTLKVITLTNVLAGIATITTSIAGIDLDGGTDIGEAIVDGDLFLVDNGANGTNRKSAISRLWTYITAKIQALSGKGTPVAADILTIQDSAASNALKELTIANLWTFLVTQLSAITDVKAYSWVVDEDDLVSGLDTKVPTQQSVKAYVDAQADWLVHDLQALGAVPDIADMMATSDEDVAGDPNRSVSIAQFFAAGGDLTDLASAPAADDRIPLTDESEAGEPARSMSVQNLFDTVNAGLASFTGAIVPGTDQLLFDDGGTGKRVTYQVFMDGIDDLAAIGAAPATTDSFLLDNGGVAKKVTLANAHLTYFKDMTPGTGISTGTGTICEHSVSTVGGIITTTILIDLTGLRSGGTIGDIIGKTGGTANCHIGQILDAVNGEIYGGRVTCLETPAGGDPDVDIWGSVDESTGAQDAAIAGLTGEEQLINHGDWTFEDVDYLDPTTLPDANGYLYLTCGQVTDVAYSAGKLLIELWGK